MKGRVAGIRALVAVSSLALVASLHSQAKLGSRRPGSIASRARLRPSTRRRRYHGQGGSSAKSPGASCTPETPPSPCATPRPRSTPSRSVARSSPREDPRPREGEDAHDGGPRRGPHQVGISGRGWRRPRPPSATPGDSLQVWGRPQTSASQRHSLPRLRLETGDAGVENGPSRRLAGRRRRWPTAADREGLAGRARHPRPTGPRRGRRRLTRKPPTARRACGTRRSARRPAGEEAQRPVVALSRHSFTTTGRAKFSSHHGRPPRAPTRRRTPP